PGRYNVANCLVAHQEVLFGTEGETLTIRHDSLDRTGPLQRRQLPGRPPGGAVRDRGGDSDHPPR
ncbi:hypothetical protein GR254_25265, partial [Mycobacterium tuberculosis]|nr:hypothetical protein [Mycobacterium tuberculosis]